eukprot:scaffold17205_cov125-Isochrysis_galbana.AAC.1
MHREHRLEDRHRPTHPSPSLTRHGLRCGGLTPPSPLSLTGVRPGQAKRRRGPGGCRAQAAPCQWVQHAGLSIV